MKGSCSGRIPAWYPKSAGEEPLVPLWLINEEAAPIDLLNPWQMRHSQQLLKLREFVANPFIRPSKWKVENGAVKLKATRRNCFCGPVTPASSDDGIAVPVCSVELKRCQRTTRLCVLIHPILPGLFAIETCRRSD
jgi:hypothetical protein